MRNKLINSAFKSVQYLGSREFTLPRWILPWKAAFPSRISVQTSKYIYDNPKWKIPGIQPGVYLQFLLLERSPTLGNRRVRVDYPGLENQKHTSHGTIQKRIYHPFGLQLGYRKVLKIAQMLLILLVISGINVFDYLGVNTPSVWEWTQQNKFYACLMTFFLCNAVEGQLISTGAFEIIFNDVPIWSKLETGRIPQPPELFQMIDNHLNMATPHHFVE
nr:EOG090X0DP2 [Macrothrix elegans]